MHFVQVLPCYLHDMICYLHALTDGVSELFLVCLYACLT